MEKLFLEILNMSITASWIALAVIIVRLLFKNLPKSFNTVLWAFVGIRLVLPFSFKSSLSVIPSADTISQDIIYSETPTIQSGIPAINSAVNSALADTFTPQVGASANPLQIVTYIATVLWILGIALMLIYALVSYIKIKKEVSERLLVSKNVYVCDRISSPFILGVIKPKIYLPSDINESDISFVTAHEKTHIKRLDHIWKPLGFLLLAVYWFNPVLWLSYILLCKDIEFACDEKVLKQMGEDNKKAYANALVNCSAKQRLVTACPVAFGETDVKGRVKNMLKYKKPAVIVVIISVILSVLIAVCVLTDPESELTQANADIDAAVSQAILDINSERNWAGECFTEGHIIFGVSEDEKNCKVYMVERFSSFGFENGWFMSQGGHTVPCVMTFKVTDNGYVYDDVEYAEDGSGNASSIKAMFPEEYESRALSITENESNLLWQQCVKQAESYLEKIGREAKVGAYGDVEHILFTDLGVSVDVSNKISNMRLAYNCSIGYYEKVEDNIRYVYRTAFLQEENVILFTKEVYGTNEVVERIEVDSLTGNVIAVNESSYYFDAKVLEVKGDQVLVEPFENSAERKSSSKIWVSTKVSSSVEIPTLYEGLYIRVMYDGMIQELYPAIIPNVAAIYMFADVNYVGNEAAASVKEPTTIAYYISE